jgi:hypothetical protein
VEGEPQSHGAFCTHVVGVTFPSPGYLRAPNGALWGGLTPPPRVREHKDPLRSFIGLAATPGTQLTSREQSVPP